MRSRNQFVREKRDLSEKVGHFALGTRFFCARNGKHYQLGAKHGLSQFWMLCEEDASKGLVDGRTILEQMKVVK